MPLNRFMSYTTEDSFGFNPTAVYHATARNSLDNIDVKELLEKLKNLDQNKSQVTVSDRVAGRNELIILRRAFFISTKSKRVH